MLVGIEQDPIELLDKIDCQVNSDTMLLRHDTVRSKALNSDTDSMIEIYKRFDRDNRNDTVVLYKSAYDTTCRESHVVECEGGKIAHLAIIDYLQLWNVNKKAERFAKVYLLGKSGEGLSAMEP